MDRLHKEVYKGYTISIFPDDDAENPRENDNLGHMICFHRRDHYGDQHEFKTPAELVQFMTRGGVIFLPVYAYEHGGIILSTSDDHYPFNDPWDAGQLGVIYVTREEVRKEYSVSRLNKKVIKQALDVLQAEVDVYSKYLSGQFCGYVVDETCVRVSPLDSVWGYEDLDTALAAAREYVDWKVEEK